LLICHSRPFSIARAIPAHKAIPQVDQPSRLRPYFATLLRIFEVFLIRTDRFILMAFHPGNLRLRIHTLNFC
jgi:hypothetical protein